jgi:hypothetical protein
MCEAAETRSYAAALSVPGGLITTTVAPQPAQPGPSFLDPLRARFGGVFGAFLQPIFEIFGNNRVSSTWRAAGLGASSNLGFPLAVFQSSFPYGRAPISRSHRRAST